MKPEDCYNTIKNPSKEILFKEKSSKFFGYAFPIRNEEDIKNALTILKKKHHTARHFCYAWQLGIEKKSYRANDDGEPNNTAGMPIYGQIKAFDVTNILIICVRYFGGTKLGIGGLISAYKNTAKQTLENSTIIEKTITIEYQLNFDYPLMNEIMRVIKEKKISIIDQELALDCTYIISIRKKEETSVFQLFDSMHLVKIIKNK